MDSTAATLDPEFAAQDESSVVIAVVATVLSLATLLVGLRLYTRLCLLKHSGWDDYCAVLTMAMILIDGGLVLSTVPYGLGKHTATLSATTIASYRRNFWASIVVYNISLALIKLTFLLQYNRVLAAHKMQKVIWTLGSIIMLWAISQVFVAIFACVPVRKFWDPSLDGTCTPNYPFWYINAGGNIATDLTIFILPLPVLSQLQLRKKQKYFLVGIFSLGFFTCAISLIRLNWLKQSADFTYDNVPTACWSVSEIACGIICACLPTLRPLVTKIKPRWMTSTATRTKTAKRQTYSGMMGGAQYGAGTQGNSDAKSAAGAHTQSLPDSSLTVSSSHKNYSRIFDDEDVEKALRMPAALTPAFRPGETKHSSESEHEAIPMNQLRRAKSSKPSLKLKWSNFTGNDKADPVPAGVDQGVGFSTRVFGGKDASSPSPRTSGCLGGIEVKRDVTVTTAPMDASDDAQLLDNPQSYRDQRR